MSVLTAMAPIQVGAPQPAQAEYVVICDSLGEWRKGTVITDADLAKKPGLDLGRLFRIKALRRATEFELGQKFVEITNLQAPSYQEELGRKDEMIARLNGRIAELEGLLTTRDIQISNFVPGQGLDNVVKQNDKIIKDLHQRLIVANQRSDALEKQLANERSWKQTAPPVLPPEKIGDGFAQTPFMRETVQIPTPTDQTEVRSQPERVPQPLPKVAPGLAGLGPQ